MAKDTRVTFDNSSPNPSKQNNRPGRHSRTERQISYEETENCVNEMSESFPALSNRAHRLMRQVSESFNFRTIKVALIISAILNLALGIPFGVFVGIYISQKSESSSSSSSAQAAHLSGNMPMHFPRQHDDYYIRSPLKTIGYNMELCISCKHIPSNRRDIWDKISITSRNGICCTKQQVPFLENLKFNLLRVEPRLRDSADLTGLYPVQPLAPIKTPCFPSSAESTAAAHMMLDVKQTKENSNNHHNKQENPLAWLFNGSKNFLGDGITYSKGKIQIVKPGHYHVYSQVTLDTNENPLEVKEKIVTFALMFSSHVPREGPLLNGPKLNGPLQSTEITMKNGEVRSMNIEGTFEFLKGDSVSVYISYPSLLKDVREGNSFGLFKLS